MNFGITIVLYGIYNYIFSIFERIIMKIHKYLDIDKINDMFMQHILDLYEKDQPRIYRKSHFDKKIKLGLLTNEIPPIVYGGVATWIVNFIKMFEDDPDIEVVPIFLAYNDKLPEECMNKYKNIRVIDREEDIYKTFKDIDVCVNNLWIALDTITKIKELFPSMNIISVCHSLIRMENITNLGSCYTNNYNQQEITFENSDYVVLISNAEKEYYDLFGYNNFKTKTRVIYNSYEPKYDDVELKINYTSDDIGYIGRHVPRKRPEIPIRAVDILKRVDINVINMGVDYDKYDNAYWRTLEKKYKEQLNIIPFTSDKDIKEKYWSQVGINCITGIYEPFGYTICEALDRRIPVIVSNIDGPKEIIEEVKEYVNTYEVDANNYDNDIINFSNALKKIWTITPEERKERAEKARKCLDKLRPDVIKEDWRKLFLEIL
jgi:glycosyltransferase involved in cell wall biosynthesis